MLSDTDEITRSTAQRWAIVDAWLHQQQPQISAASAASEAAQSYGAWAAAIASLERTDETLALLELLHDYQAHARANQELASQFNRHMAREYETQTACMTQALQATSMSLANVPPSLKDQLESLSSIAVLLDLKDVTLSSFQVALCTWCNRYWAQKRTLLELRSQQRRIQQRRQDAQRQLQKVKRVLSQATAARPMEEQKVREWRHNTQLLSQKTKEYATRVADLDNAVQAIDPVAKQIDYDSLKRSNGRIAELSELLDQHQAKVNSYMALPPDITLAKLKLDEANAHLVSSKQKRLNARKSKKDDPKPAADKAPNKQVNPDDLPLDKLALDNDLVVTGVLTSLETARDVKAESFSLSFHGRELISNTTLEINHGRRYGLLGANGSGK
ncbi:ABC transporter ATP-binding protein arb1, partial [Dimargaris xerosporica]